MNTDLIRYYAGRAQEYEQLYTKPERQRDLRRLTAILQDIFREKAILEIACGTGWFTQHLARSCAAVLATDINASMLDIARAKNYPPGTVRFQCDDIFDTAIDRQFEGLFAGFIWSHILLEQLDTFLAQCRQWVLPGGPLVFVDNLYVPGSSTPVQHTDAMGNTYQQRQLRDGSEHLVLKNFPAKPFLIQTLENQGLECEILSLDFYWITVCRSAVPL